MGLCYRDSTGKSRMVQSRSLHRPSLSLRPFFQPCLKFKPSRIGFKVQHVVKPAFSLLLAFSHQLPLLLLKLPPKHFIFLRFLILQAGILKLLKPGIHHCLQVFFQPAPLSSQPSLFPGESQTPPPLLPSKCLLNNLLFSKACQN